MSSFHIDDIVLFTPSHWEWLVRAGKRDPRRAREQEWGQVVELGEEGTLCVHWLDGTHSCTWHLACNLEWAL